MTLFRWLITNPCYFYRYRVDIVFDFIKFPNSNLNGKNIIFCCRYIIHRSSKTKIISMNNLGGLLQIHGLFTVILSILTSILKKLSKKCLKKSRISFLLFEHCIQTQRDKKVILTYNLSGFLQIHGMLTVIWSLLFLLLPQQITYKWQEKTKIKFF